MSASSLVLVSPHGPRRLPPFSFFGGPCPVPAYTVSCSLHEDCLRAPTQYELRELAADPSPPPPPATLAGAFSGLLAYAIGFMSGVGGYAGWRWIFIVSSYRFCPPLPPAFETSRYVPSRQMLTPPPCLLSTARRPGDPRCRRRVVLAHFRLPQRVPLAHAGGEGVAHLPPRHRQLQGRRGRTRQQEVRRVGVHDVADLPLDRLLPGSCRPSLRHFAHFAHPRRRARRLHPRPDSAPHGALLCRRVHLRHGHLAPLRPLQDPVPLPHARAHALHHWSGHQQCVLGPLNPRCRPLAPKADTLLWSCAAVSPAPNGVKYFGIYLIAAGAYGGLPTTGASPEIPVFLTVSG